ncbi:MAG: sensor histidine kinase, partial [Romboutsia sp.]|uniref:sensor histidine kinase n=1 Tax=Romboutsia sp. TaxID=1965302 RepID=UPI003F32E707
DLNDKIDIEEQEDELDMIAISINEMSESLEFYIKNHYDAYVRQKEAEMSALQSQIKPHFLFNTLEVIRMYALTSNNKDVAKMIFNLANMFRYSTYDNGSMVTLNDEIKHCKMYLDLCCSRYKGLIKYDININDDMLDLRVPKFLLQPILENSINHGLDKSSNDNLISIDIFELNENLKIIVTDNGYGMNEEKLSETRYGLEKNMHKSDSIGLMNTNNRLKLKFGYEYGIELDSEVNKGTIVKIKLPVIRGEC